MRVMRLQASPWIIVSQLPVPVWGCPPLSGVVEDRSVGHPVNLDLSAIQIVDRRTVHRGLEGQRDYP